MDCPVCKGIMIVLELEEVEIDYCTHCQGIWLDRGELEILLEDSSATQQVLESFKPAQTTEENRKCPICMKPMEKVLVGSNETSQQIIDNCKNNHGLWFDRGELQEVLRMGHFDDEGKVQHLLGAIFHSTPEK